jgi:hypothetical protein
MAALIPPVRQWLWAIRIALCAKQPSRPPHACASDTECYATRPLRQKGRSSSNRIRTGEPQRYPTSLPAHILMAARMRCNIAAEPPSLLSEPAETERDNAGAGLASCRADRNCLGGRRLSGSVWMGMGRGEGG